EQVDRARPREEEREEERDRPERLLASGEQRQARHLLPSRTELDLDAGVLVLLLGLRQTQPPFTAGEERGRNLGEVRLHGGERLREPLLDRARQLVAQLLELREARLEPFALSGQLLEPLPP